MEESKQFFLNSIYIRSKKHFVNDGNKVSKRNVYTEIPDVLFYILKDIETLESKLYLIKHPLIDYYVAKTHQGYQKVSINKDDCYKRTVRYEDRLKEIAKEFNMLDLYYDLSKSKNVYLFQRKASRIPDLYLGDVDIEDYYKTRCMLKYGKDVFPRAYKKAFSDIETDISEYNLGFANPEVAPCKIYLISTIHSDEKEIYSFILYDERVKDEQKWILNNPNEFIKEYIKGPIKNVNFTYHFLLFKDEISLIKAYFENIHKYKPDFVLWWNMPFDIQTILNRLGRLGLSEEEIANICCHPEIPKEFRIVSYKKDPNRVPDTLSEEEEENDSYEDKKRIFSNNKKSRPHPSRLWDWVQITGYSQNVDQMAMFSSLRLQETYPSYKLNDIGIQFGGVSKLDLEEEGYSIKNVNVKNFKIALAYNIQDIFVQYRIEEAQGDIDTFVFGSGNSRISQAFKQSVLNKNEIMIRYFLNNEIIGNSVSYEVSEKVRGALTSRVELLEQTGIDLCYI